MTKMPEPRYRRRKEERLQEITEAAFTAFAENGYAATRVEDVAKRAGVSKGLLYLYFRTKEELFKAVVQSVVVPRIDALVAEAERADQTAEGFLRGPIVQLMKSIPGSPVSIVIRLMITEGRNHPDLVEWYWDNVASRGMAMIRGLLERGVECLLLDVGDHHVHARGAERVRHGQSHTAGATGNEGGLACHVVHLTLIPQLLC